jgi:predicted Rossmann-fold nucleotide-binding protein
VAPGGIATVLESMMIWQLLQVRHLRDTPWILVGRLGLGLVDWAREAMHSFSLPIANADDFAIRHCVPAADDAIELIREHDARWQGEKESL